MGLTKLTRYVCYVYTYVLYIQKHIHIFISLYFIINYERIHTNSEQNERD
jgi:hypothetical protein